MKIRIYPSDYSKDLSEMTMIGKDSNGGFYMIDVAHICPHEEHDRESLERISWNNVDVQKTKEDNGKAAS